MHLTSALNSLEKNTQELLIVNNNLGITQHSLGNFNAALDSYEHALDIRLKLFGEEHEVTAKSYFSLGISQHALGNFEAALESK